MIGKRDVADDLIHLIAVKMKIGLQDKGKIIGLREFDELEEIIFQLFVMDGRRDDGGRRAAGRLSLSRSVIKFVRRRPAGQFGGDHGV